MQIIPAIDIMDNKLVRLTKGDPVTRESYSIEDPIQAAKDWADKGATLVHMIDLDAALGKTPNTETILAIADQGIRLQVGGGIRSIETAEKLLEGGVDRIILGSLPVKSPETAQILLEKYGSERIIIALDHRDGFLMVKGWQESTKRSLIDSLGFFKKNGFTRFLVTNIDHDGTLEGPDLKTYREISGEANIIASGGVSKIKDIQELRKSGIESVVIGKALYMDRFTLQEAMEAAPC